jgi:putative spermidine/putrescine transport system substrate-binding protein
MWRTTSSSPAPTAGRGLEPELDRKGARSRSTTTRSSSPTPPLPEGDEARPRDRQPVPAERRAVHSAIDLLKQLKPNVGEWWADYAKQIQSYANKDVVIGTTWPYHGEHPQGDKKPVAGDQAEGRARPAGRTPG